MEKEFKGKSSFSLGAEHTCLNPLAGHPFNQRIGRPLQNHLPLDTDCQKLILERNQTNWFDCALVIEGPGGTTREAERSAQEQNKNS